MVDFGALRPGVDGVEVVDVMVELGWSWGWADDAWEGGAASVEDGFLADEGMKLGWLKSRWR